MHQKSFNGCWTCRLRRKKCDETQPMCDTCTALDITCHYGSEKPEWMDGGVKQEKMAETIKREVKEGALRRRTGRAFALASSHHDPRAKNAAEAQKRRSPETSTSSTVRDPSLTNHDDSRTSESSLPPSQRTADCKLAPLIPRGSLSFGRSDTFLMMFYLEHLLPFLFPFYNPAPEGGKAWILEMMISSPVVRQATLCQSSYFYSLANGTIDQDEAWETVVAQSQEAFGVLGQSLQVIEGSDIADHLHGAVRILASIMQVQRFEISLLSFQNCHAHLNAAVALFNQLLVRIDPEDQMEPGARINTLLDRLGPPLTVAQSTQVPSAEQTAFKFSTSLLILDDIIASTVFQEEPGLLAYHSALLEKSAEREPIIDLEGVMGCQNWAMLAVADIAVLDAWKRKSQVAGTLDVMELVRRATEIKSALDAKLSHIEAQPAIRCAGNNFSGIFGQQFTPASQSRLATRVWAHAALIYLSVIVSGWQRASVQVRYHISQVLDLLENQISPPMLLRTMTWPFSVVGCVADPEQEGSLRRIADALQPARIFGTVRKSLHIMEQAWLTRTEGSSMNFELTTGFRCHGNLVLLV